MGGLLDWWEETWDKISGNKAKRSAEKQIDTSIQASQTATAQQIEYLKEAQALSEKFQAEQLEKQLAAIQQGQQAGIQGGMLDQSAGLAQLIARLQMASAQQEQNMPKSIAQAALLRQALPNILAMSGGTPVNLPNTVSSIDYAKLAQSIPGLLQQSINQMKPIYDQVYGTQGGTFGSATPGGILSSQPFSIPSMSTEIPYSNTPVDVRALVMQDPEYALQNQSMNENLNRKLTGMGKTSSSDALYMGGRLGQQLMSDAYNKAYNKQLNLFQMAMGENPIQQSTNAASLAMSGLGGMGGGAASAALQNAANARSTIYGNQISSAASTHAQIGQLLGQQGQNALNLGIRRAGLTANQPSYLDLIGQAAKLYYGGWGNLFGGGNSSDLDWYNSLGTTGGSTSANSLARSY